MLFDLFQEYGINEDPSLWEKRIPANANHYHPQPLASISEYRSKGIGLGDLDRTTQGYIMIYAGSRMILVLGAVSLATAEIFKIPELHNPAVISTLIFIY